MFSSNTLPPGGSNAEAAAEFPIGNDQLIRGRARFQVGGLHNIRPGRPKMSPMNRIRCVEMKLMVTRARVPAPRRA